MISSCSLEATEQDVLQEPDLVSLMSMLPFFPWIEVKEELKLGEFQLVPYEPGRTPGGAGTELQASLDSVLQHYVDVNQESIRHATLVVADGHQVFDDLTEEERASYFNFAELVAFGGLAKREFFGLGNRYCNRDDFTFTVQGFRQESSGVGIVSRRRDGGKNAFVTATIYRVQRPFHVQSGWDVKLDVPLVNALLDVREHDKWPAYFEAISGFNQANTDSDQSSEAGELVATVGALERLFDCNRGRGEDLATRFMQAFQTTERMSVASCSRIPGERFRRCQSLAEVWIRDLFQLRGDLAHGKHSIRYPAVWNTQEHLLLSSFVFPRIVKSVLASEGHYTLTDEDRMDLATFERFVACDDLFSVPDDDADSQPRPWDKIVQDAMWEDLSEGVEEQLDKAEIPERSEDA